MCKYINPQKYLRAIKNRFPIFASPFIRQWEKGKIDHYGKQLPKHQPIFIIGAPRTGTTILYQSLTNLFDVLYIDNLVCKYHKNLFFGFCLSNKHFGDAPHNNFLADYGDTTEFGLHAPSECGQFWYRWLPTDHHFIDFNEIPDEMIEQIRLEVTAVINYFNKPLLFKNLNAGQRLRLIHQCFPESFFIYVRREPFFTIQSILVARKTNNVLKNEIWSIKPKNYLELLALDEISMVTAQVYYLEKQIENDLLLFNSNNSITIQYEEMASDFNSYLSEIEKKFTLSMKQQKCFIPNIYCESKSIVSNKLADNIKKAIQQYEW